MDEEKPKLVIEDVNSSEIILNEKAADIYSNLILLFPNIKTNYIKSLCHTYVKKESNQNPNKLLGTLIEKLVNCDKDDFEQSIRQMEKEPAYDINEKFKILLKIFPQAVPEYLRNELKKINNDEQFIKFVLEKLEKEDFPIKQQYLEKKITEQQTQYPTDSEVEAFLNNFPDPFSCFEDEERSCQYDENAVNFLKNHYNTHKVKILKKLYSDNKYNLSLTARAVEKLEPNMKSERKKNENLIPENILQECTFIQLKKEIQIYLKNNVNQLYQKLEAKDKLICQYCDNKCMPSKCSTCKSDHVFCNLCIIQKCTDVVAINGETRIDCLLHCGSEFLMSVLEDVLPPTIFIFRNFLLYYKQQEAEVKAAEIEGLVSCPFCYFESIPPPEDKIFKCPNPECMKESCREGLCKKPNHMPVKCESEIKKKSESARLYLEKMTQALVRKCYSCNQMFDKAAGCKIECICGAQICYICNKPVTDCKHFQDQGAEPMQINMC